MPRLHLRLSELRVPLSDGEEELPVAICRRLRLPAESLTGFRVVRRSVDARRKEAIQIVYGLDLELRLESGARRRLLNRFRGDPHLKPIPDDRYLLVGRAPMRAQSAVGRPLVVGAGPCGYFAALLLAQMGFRPLLLERGKAVKERTADTFGFWRGTRTFDPESNAQFGEGGAGTFSDGKLYSRISEPARYVRKVLEELVEAGANPEILTHHRPHIGTFKLATVVRGLRARIEALGGEVRFLSRVSDLVLEAGPSRRVAGVDLQDGSRIATTHLVLAVGHSARDTFEMLERHGVAMAPKPFAVGLRIEHPQALIDRARWGPAAGHPRLGAAEYKLVHHTSGGRAVYSFCMCPGGFVVGATSEQGCVVTNGMSQHSRNERNANAALVVSTDEADLAPWARWPGDPLAGVEFQRHWEQRAFLAGGGDYRAPAQEITDFLGNGSGPQEPPEAVQASCRPGVRMVSLDQCLPSFAIEAIREALPRFERQIPGYIRAGVLLTGVETRTSSPVRLHRDPASLESLNTRGLYPAGEGAGHAGGILSAAIDGIKVAEAVAISLLAPDAGDPPPQEPLGVGRI